MSDTRTEREKETLRYRVALAGYVTHAETGKALAGARVEMTKMPAAYALVVERMQKQVGAGAWGRMPRRLDRTETRWDGLFFFANLPDGAYKVELSLPGMGKRFGVVSKTAKVGRDKDGGWRPVWVNAALPPTLVRGSIVGREVGVALARVRVKGSDESAFSDSEGWYVIAGIEPGKERMLTVSAQGFEVMSKPLAIAGAGGSQTVDFVLQALPGGMHGLPG